MTFVFLFGFSSDLESNIDGINEDLKNFESRLKFASEIQSVAEVGTVQCCIKNLRHHSLYYQVLVFAIVCPIDQFRYIKIQP